jgi:hypothetical protein
LSAPDFSQQKSPSGSFEPFGLHRLAGSTTVGDPASHERGSGRVPAALI